MRENRRKLEKKKILISVLVGVLIVFLIPIKSTPDDGTKVYMSMFYKVVCRNELNPEYIKEVEEQGYSNRERTLTGTDVYIFPFNFFAE